MTSRANLLAAAGEYIAYDAADPEWNPDYRPITAIIGAVVYRLFHYVSYRHAELTLKGEREKRGIDARLTLDSFACSLKAEIDEQHRNLIPLYSDSNSARTQK